MPAYDICYLNDSGALTYKFSANCDDDQRAKVLAHAMKLPSMKRLEVWNGSTLVYARPSPESSPRRAGPRHRFMDKRARAGMGMPSGVAGL